MANSPIDLELKKKCVQLANDGVTARQIYEEVFKPERDTMTFNTFRRKLLDWKRKSYPDDATLEAGTYRGFIAHGATVQVDATGNIRQAWIKQDADETQYDEILEAIKQNVEPIKVEHISTDGDGMLEVPLFDMHFPLSEHKETLNELIGIIQRKEWDEINFIVGQDLFHNDDRRGRTSSGRVIERVDMTKAWNMAVHFYYNAIERALTHANRVRLVYSKGNHDESVAWCFVQLLKEHFPQVVVDDSFRQRKCITWKKCFIGFTHGAYKMSTNNDLRGQFTIEFPTQFSGAEVREIHAGHLHTEKEQDVYGVMCRRLSRAGITDEWSDDEGYVGANKRFMVFEWAPNSLKAIYYI